MKHLGLILIVFIFTACGPEKVATPNTPNTPSINPAELSGKVGNYTGGTGTIEVDSGNGYNLTTGAINADGTFKIVLPDPSSDQFPLLTDKAMYNCKTMTFTSTSARGASMLDMRVINEKGKFVGWLMQGSSLKAVEDYYSGKAVGQAIARMYSTEDVKVTGERCYDNPETSSVTFDISLKKGWNLMTVDLEQDKTFRFFNTTSFKGIDWYFATQRNF